MNIRTAVNCLGALAACCTLAAHPAQAAANQPAPKTDLGSSQATGHSFFADRARIKELAGTTNLAALDKVCDDVEANWEHRRDAFAYFTLILDMVNTITSVKTLPQDIVGVEEKDRLIHKYALLAVNRGDAPVNLARILFGFLISEDLTEQGNGTLSLDQWQQTRKERAVMWLSKWKELSSYQSPPYDFQAAFSQQNAIRTQLASTTTGSDEQKKQLDELWALNRQVSGQTFLEIDTRLFRGAAIRSLVWYYSAGAPNSSELQQLMDTYGIDAASQADILSKVPK